MRQKQQSIKTRILLTFTIIMALFIGILARTGYVTIRRVYLDEAQSYLQRMTLMIGREVNTKYLPYLLPEADNAANLFFKASLRPVLKASKLTGIFIFNRQKQVLFNSGPAMSAAQLYLSKTEIDSLSTDEARVSVPFAAASGKWYLWGFYRIDTNYYIGVRESVAQLQALNTMGRLFLFVALGAIAVIVMASFFIARSIARPIGRLVDFSATVAKRDFSAPAPPPMAGELSILRETLVNMQNAIRGHNEDRENMIAQIAHEIRNPLGGIELLCGLIQEDAEGNPAIFDNTQKIRRQIATLKNQLGAFLDYSRPIKANPQTVDLIQLYSELQLSIRPLLKSKGKHIQTAGFKGKIIFDPDQLKQVLFNLLKNAIEAGGPDTEIRLYAHSAANGTQLIIEDKGEGVPAENVDKLFNPFFTTREQGTGLGLAVCEKLCRSNHAQLHLDTNYSRGARFVIELNNSGDIKNG